MIDVLRQIPAVDQLKKDNRFQTLLNTTNFSEERLTNWLQHHLDDMRREILQGKLENNENLNRENLSERILSSLEWTTRRFSQNRLRPVLNATGVVLHTNLGRARLSEKALNQMVDAARSYSTLEYNLLNGERGSRHDIVEDYLRLLTGAEAAIVVNNNAAAVFLVLKAFASSKEVVVSRGELVEIGGSFRISEIMEESGATLVGVGTTNKTHLRDYEKAIHDETALVMKVHKSNFYVSGFTEEVAASDLVDVVRERNIPLFEDLGSGALYDFGRHGNGSETVIQEKVKAGIDLISFSGDKLLGGPQAGIIVGKKAMIDLLKKHQLARVLRVDKFTLAALEATLKSYLMNEAEREIPTIRDILETKAAVKKKAETFVKAG